MISGNSSTTPPLEVVRAFRQGKAATISKPVSKNGADVLSLPNWSDDDWLIFLKHVEPQSVAPGESLIQRGEAGSNLYFVVGGQFEILLSQSDGMSLGALKRVQAGSVIGEIAFFDEGPRTVNVWSTKSSAVLRMSRQQFKDLESDSPRLAHDLVSSLARILAVRLRQATARPSKNR